MASGQSRWLRTRRLVAGLIDATVCSAVVIGIALLATYSNLLYGYDGIALGALVVPIVWSVLEAILGTTLGRGAMRLRVVAYDLQPAGRVRLGFRALLLWVLMTSPGSVGTDLLRDLLPLGFRDTALIYLALMCLLRLLPLATIIASGGYVGIHDLVTGTIVVGAADAPPRRRPATHLPRLATGGFCGILLALVGSDWSSQTSNRLADAMAVHPRYTQSILDLLERGAALSVLGVTPPVAQDYYFVPGTDLALPGRTEYYSFPVTREIVTDDARLFATARELLTGLLWEIEPGTRWVDLEFYSVDRFGYAGVKHAVHLSLKMQGMQLRFAPSLIVTDSSLSFAAGREGTWDVWHITHFDRQQLREAELGLNDWRFGDWNVLARPPLYPEHEH